METLLITVRDDDKRDKIEQMLREMDGVEYIRRIPAPDEVSLLAQYALAEEWNSAEDQRWDTLL